MPEVSAGQIAPRLIARGFTIVCGMLAPERDIRSESCIVRITLAYNICAPYSAERVEKNWTPRS